MRARLLPGVLLLVPAAVPAAFHIPKPDELVARQLVTTPVVCPNFVFDGKPFPDVRVEWPKPVRPVADVMSAEPFRTRPVRSPAEPGPYAVVLAQDTSTGSTVRRNITVFRTAKKVDPSWKFDPARPEELAAFAGVDRALVEKQAALIAGVCKDRPFAQLAADQRFARLLAGLALMPQDSGQVTKQNDAFACERQAWVRETAAGSRYSPRIRSRGRC